MEAFGKNAEENTQKTNEQNDRSSNNERLESIESPRKATILAEAEANENQKKL